MADQRIRFEEPCPLLGSPSVLQQRASLRPVIAICTLLGCIAFLFRSPSERVLLRGTSLNVAAPVRPAMLARTASTSQIMKSAGSRQGKAASWDAASVAKVPSSNSIVTSSQPLSRRQTEAHHPALGVNTILLAAAGFATAALYLASRSRSTTSIVMAGVSSRKDSVLRSTKAAEQVAQSSSTGTARSPIPLLDPSKSYSHVSPGVCDACITDGGVRSAWVALLRGQLPSHQSNIKRTAERAATPAEAVQLLTNYERWEKLYIALLDRLEEDPYVHQPPPTLLWMVEEKERVLRATGLPDPFLALKQDENDVALTLFPAVCAELDALWTPGSAPDQKDAQRAMLLLTLECALAGNLFDAGAANAVAAVAFCEAEDCDLPEDSNVLSARAVADTYAKIRVQVARPTSGWRYDSFDGVAERAGTRPWRRAVLFCDNAGADVMSMVLLARQLLSVAHAADARVVVTANATPALNDITIDELREFVAAASATDPVLAAQVSSGRLVCLPSGQDSTLLDLARCGPELNSWIEAELNNAPPEDWLVVLGGMGRSIESNWLAGQYFREGVDVLSVAMIKSQINADRLKSEVYDCVVRLHGANNPGPA